MATFATHLTDIMLDREIKSHELATALGINTSTVNDWKRGKYQLFLSNLLKLADFFNCSLEFLMGRTDTEITYIPKECPPFYERLVTVMKEYGVTTYRIRKDTVLNGAYFDNWKKGADPLASTLIIVADYLGITLDYLVGRDR